MAAIGGALYDKITKPFHIFQHLSAAPKKVIWTEVSGITLFHNVSMYIPHFSVKNEYIDNFGGHWGHLKVVDRSNIENREYLQMSKIILNCSQLNLSQTLPQSHFLLLLHPPFYFCQKTWLSSLWVNLYFLCYLILQYFLFSYPSSWKSY